MATKDKPEYKGFQTGDIAVRKGRLCVISKINWDTSPPDVTVKMQDTGDQIGTEFSRLSRPTDEDMLKFPMEDKKKENAPSIANNNKKRTFFDAFFEERKHKFTNNTSSNNNTNNVRISPCNIIPQISSTSIYTDIDSTTFEDLLSDGPSTKRRKLNNFAQGWYCSACTLENPDLDCLKCSLCETPRTFTEKIKYPAVHPVILPLDDDDDDDNEEKENDNTQNSLTFITWNVWFEEGIQVIERMKAIGNIIDNHNADIVCFQEITPFILDILQNGDWYTKNGYSSTILPSHGMFEGLSYFNVIMTRHEFIRDAIQFKYFTNTQMGRHLIITPIQFKCNATSQLKIVYAATSHLESPVGPWAGGKKDKFSAERKEQLRYSLQVLDDHKICDNNNVIFGGDFNWCRQTKNNENDGDLNKYLNGNWIDCWDKVHRNDRNDGYTYDAKTNGMLSGNLRNRLDRIVYKHNSDLKLKSCEMIGTEAIPSITYLKTFKRKNGTQEKVLPVLPSDHYGLVAKFDID